MRLLILLLCLQPLHVLAMGNDDLWLTLFTIDQLNAFSFDDKLAGDYKADISSGLTLKKALLKLEGEKTAHENQHEAALYYQQAISSYWNLLVGLRQDYGDEQASFISAGFKGVAPYFIESEWLLFANDDVIALRTELEKEWMLSQRWALVSELEATWYDENPYAKNSDDSASVSEAELSFLLEYQVTRQFLPYVGYRFEYEKKAGKSEQERYWIVGISAWF